MDVATTTPVETTTLAETSTVATTDAAMTDAMVATAVEDVVRSTCPVAARPRPDDGTTGMTDETTGTTGDPGPLPGSVSARPSGSVPLLASERR